MSVTRQDLGFPRHMSNAKWTILYNYLMAGTSCFLGNDNDVQIVLD